MQVAPRRKSRMRKALNKSDFVAPAKAGAQSNQ